MPATLEPRAGKAVGTLQPQKAEHTTEMHNFCAEWSRSKDFQAFSNLIRFCLRNQMMCLADFRDYFGIMPAAVIMWALGSMEPPDPVQKEVVEFIEHRAPFLPVRKPRPAEAAALLRFYRQLPSL